jgi:hypothetical protein
MNAKTTASTKTFLKFVIWAAAGAAVAAALNNLASLNLPDWAGMIAGAVLKAAATWIATQNE